MARGFGAGFVAEESDGAKLRFRWLKRGERWRVTYEPAKRAIEIAREMDREFQPPQSPIILIEGDIDTDVVTLHPLNMDAMSPNFLAPRHAPLETITLKGFGFDTVSHIADVENALEVLSAGFVRSPYRGLGLNYDIRYIVDAVEKVPGISDLRIERDSRGAASIDGASFVLPFALFEVVRKDIGRVHDKALAVARVEKTARLNDKLLHPLDPEQFPAIGQPYHPDAIVKAVGDGLQQGLQISLADAKLIVSAAAAMMPEVAKSEPAELLKLTEAVETVTLEAMIAHMRARIAANHAEASWQKFLGENAFILRLAFGVPVLLLQEQATVGGRAYNGRGDKKTDFLLQAAKSGNLAIVEIKSPKTDLLDSRDYRGGIYPPHRELSGAVNQVLDQRWHLQRHELGLSDALDRQRDAAGIEDPTPSPQTYAIQCLVIVGTTPKTKDHQKSFELYRNGLSGVTVITYDELLLKMQTLLHLLKDPEAKSLAVPTVTTKKPNRRRGSRHNKRPLRSSRTAGARSRVKA
ncbi:MAG: hypothetical protein QOH81_266 [Sphingomonadales bacterium]|jgi:hypothetical protein|nr:hypothetical protein [Sphingomonadales bacterium]